LWERKLERERERERESKKSINKQYLYWLIIGEWLIEDKLEIYLVPTVEIMIEMFFIYQSFFRNYAICGTWTSYFQSVT